MNKKYFTFEDHLRESLKNPKFRKAWEESEAEYLLGCALIEARLKKKMSQRTLAKKTKTTQAIISRIETMNANPSLSLIKRIATVLNMKLFLKFQPS